MADFQTASQKLLTQLTTIIKNLDETRASLIAAGETKLQVIYKGQSVIDPLNVRQVADDVRRLDAQESIIKLFDADKRINLAALRDIAYELNLSLPRSANSKAKAALYIAQTMVEQRRRNQAC